MNNYKSFSELKEELGNNYDFKLYEMGISALKEIENLQQENKQLNNILTELEKWLKETRINSAFIDEQTIMEVQLKIQELKEKYK